MKDEQQAESKLSDGRRDIHTSESLVFYADGERFVRVTPTETESNQICGAAEEVADGESG